MYESKISGAQTLASARLITVGGIVLSNDLLNLPLLCLVKNILVAIIVDTPKQQSI